MPWYADSMSMAVPAGRGIVDHGSGRRAVPAHGGREPPRYGRTRAGSAALPRRARPGTCHRDRDGPDPTGDRCGAGTNALRTSTTSGDPQMWTRDVDLQIEDAHHEVTGDDHGSEDDQAEPEVRVVPDTTVRPFLMGLCDRALRGRCFTRGSQWVGHVRSLHRGVRGPRASARRPVRSLAGRARWRTLSPTFSQFCLTGRTRSVLERMGPRPAGQPECRLKVSRTPDSRSRSLSGTRSGCGTR